jgi:UDPglucose--hexose-1-phosphate uridylyltransferase
MTSENFEGQWEKRWHPLRQEWVVYAAHRNNRPWNMSTLEVQKKQVPAYLPDCYLCPGNQRVSGAKNPDYKDVYIFDNDHPVVGLQAPEIPAHQQFTGNGLYRRAAAKGIARVVCYDPRHNVTMAEMQVSGVVKVFAAWRQQMIDLAKISQVKNVLIFENKGEVVGVSNPHPHCQIYATDFYTTSVNKLLHSAKEYKQATNQNIFAQIIENEQAEGVRIIAENENAIAFIPFFARFAYEVMIFPKRKHATLATLTDTELADLAAVFQEVIRRYDMNYRMSFPYILAIQQAPLDGEYPEHHLYLSLLPPLRQPSLQKFLAGPETGADTFMSDTIPEMKAKELRQIDVTQYEELFGL